MFFTYFFAACLAVVALAAPDKLPVNINYRPPQQIIVQAPQPQYSQPQQQFGSAIQQQFVPAPQPQPSYRPQPAPPVAPPRYDFNWAVKDDYSGNDFGHTENRDGYNTKGSYYVLLPDGRRQTVTYYVNGDSGFVAEVTYEGEARFPEPQQYRPQPPPQPQPSYPQPQQPQYL